MIIDEEIEIRINASNADYYRSKGYNIQGIFKKGVFRFSKNSTYLKVRSLDISPGSSTNIKRKCICCNEISSVQRASYREICGNCVKKRCIIGEKCKKERSHHNLCKCGERKIARSNFCTKCYHKSRIGSGIGPKRCHGCGIQFKDYVKKTFCLNCYNNNRPKGEKHPNFNSNLSDKDRVKHSHSQSFREWLLCVKKRDEFKCRVCGFNKGKILCSHHLDGWNKFPDKRFIIENGITLCRHCHQSFHKDYGYGGNTKEQFEIWKNSLINKI